MEKLPAETAIGSKPARRWPFFWMGVLLFLLGPGIYAVRLWLNHLEAPWYAPGLASIGVVLMVISVWRRRGVLRTAGLILFLLVCGLEWFMMLLGTRTPPYTGPAKPGLKAPVFATTLADGSAFTHQDLEKGGSTILLFFRGRW